MGRTTQVISISIPPEMTSQIDRLAKNESRTRSELLREALRRYLEEQTWKKIFNYGRMKARTLGITGKETEEIVDEYRR
jgi:CopG family transcriptional regulator / antitoxin EndoAI